jgi:hypothetical protein
VNENTIAVMTVTATDSDGDPLTYTLRGGADRQAFRIGAATGVLEFVAPPDFEAPGDANLDNVYEVQVGVDDGGGTPVNQMIRVTVRDVDENRPTVDIVNVAPDPRFGTVGEIAIVFNEAVTGFGLSDLRFTRSTDDVVNLLPGSATLTTADNITWTLGNLGDATRASGIYELAIVSAGSGILDAAGNPLQGDAVEEWINGAGDANEDGQFNQLDVVATLQAFKYMTGQPATWSEGDFNGDNLFNQFDIILSQQTRPPHYLQGPLAARQVGREASFGETDGRLVDVALQQLLEASGPF